jgi:sulfate adenylyltransferase
MDELMKETTSKLIEPYGGQLVSLVAQEDCYEELNSYAKRLPSIRLSERSLCDLELLAVGAFSPLDRFMGAGDYQRALDDMRLLNGALFPLPITLPVSEEALSTIRLDQDIALRNAHNELLAIMTVEEIYPWDLREAAVKALGTESLTHPLVSEMRSWGRFNLSGRLQVLRLPRHHDFQSLRLTPQQTRERLGAGKRTEVVAFQTRNPMHRAHEELTKRAIEELDGVLLLHPVVGMTKPGDVDHYTRVRTYVALTQRYYDPGRVLLSLLPLAMRLAGPREALWHALIRRNYGAKHLIVGRDHASPGTDHEGKPFYDPYEAQELVAQYQDEVGVGVISFSELVYVPEEGRYIEASAAAPSMRTISISGTQVREQYLNKGRRLPEWFTRPEVAEVLAHAYPPRGQQGVCIWFTGLSCSGKSTTAEILTAMLLESGRRVTLLDGDVVRTHLSKGLGFSREDRDLNIRRVAFVASEVVSHGGIAITATISPYRSTRNDIRNMIGEGHFIEVFMDTPLEICEQRDIKGLYIKARRGEIENFTGINDPYEPPLRPEIRLNAVEYSPEDNAKQILDCLRESGFVDGVEEMAHATSIGDKL